MKSVFKSPELRAEILGHYNQILAALPFEKQFIETPFGKTFALMTGAPENPPLILLHGSCSNSAFWFAEMMALAPSHRVIAIDLLGEAGNSAENRLDLCGDSYADWLGTVMDALSIDSAAFAGNSLGGFLALKFAARFPTRVSKLALLSAGGVASVHAAPLARAKSGAPLTLDPAASGGASLPPEVVAFINLILSGFLPITEALPILPDESLAHLSMPLLAVYGKNDVMLDSRAAADRLRRQLPHTQLVWLEDAGHIIPNAAAYLLPFFTKEDA